MATFGHRLRQLRTARQLNQKQLGDILGVTNAAISAYEVGKNQPDFDMLQKIASYFGVSIDYLLGNTDDPQGFLRGTAERVADSHTGIAAAGLEEFLKQLVPVPPDGPRELRLAVALSNYAIMDGIIRQRNLEAAPGLKAIPWPAMKALRGEIIRSRVPVSDQDVERFVALVEHARTTYAWWSEVAGRWDASPATGANDELVVVFRGKRQQLSPEYQLLLRKMLEANDESK